MQRIALLTRLVLTGMLAVLISAAPVADKGLEAKRKAGAQALRAGNPQEALVFLAEVAASPEATYQDQLALGRVLDKLSRGAEAAPSYRRVLDMTSETTKDADERSARGEAERRMRVLDPLWDKLRVARDRFMKDLDAVDREAEFVGNEAAAEQVCRLRGAVYRAENNPNVGTYVLSAAMLGWQSTGFRVIAGQTYHVRTRGKVKLNDKPDGEITAKGRLLGRIRADASAASLGEDADFVAPDTGILELNVQGTVPSGKGGSFRIYIERR